LKQLQAQADGLLTDWHALAGTEARTFVTAKLSTLAERQDQLTGELADLDRALTEVEALGHLTEIYGHLKPFEQKELFQLLVHRAEIREGEIALEIEMGPCANIAQGPRVLSQGALRSARPDWLPDQDSNLEHSG
jgi:hypothetical protein